jgi:hypothetical protein
MNSMIQKTMEEEVVQLEQLKSVIEEQAAES